MQQGSRGEGRGRRKRNRELGGKKIKRQRNWRIHKGLNGLNAVKGQTGRVYSRAVGVAKWPIKNVSNVASIGSGGRGECIVRGRQRSKAAQ